MTTQSAPAAVIVTPAASLVIGAYGDEFRFHLTSEHTNGKFTLFTDITPPGGGPPPHYHANEDETFTVIEGQAEFLLDDEWIAVPAGTTLHLPKGVRHTFRNVGCVPLRQLIKTSPSGFEDFIAESEAEFSGGDHVDTARLAAIAAKHGIFFDGAHPDQGVTVMAAQ